MNLFDNISYLQFGSNSQQDAYHVLTKYQVMEKLGSYTPILAGTVPLNIQIPGSDLDVICYFIDKELFKMVLERSFSKFNGFTLTNIDINGQDSVVANMNIDNWKVEIFGQSVPVKNQNAYRHMEAEHRFLYKKGESLRQEVIKLKLQGYKTEPAFAKALGLKGNPYTALLTVDTDAL
jgi:hypothetical protein